MFQSNLLDKMMKLRVRSIETRETLKVEVPIQCSLQHLKQHISQRLSSSSSNASPTLPDSIHLSLNRSDEIQSSSPNEDTLQSLGITSGDLIYYTVKINPNGFPSATLIPVSQNPIPMPAAHNSSLGHEARQEPSSMESQNPYNISNADHKPHQEPSLMESQNPQIAVPNLPLQQDHQLESVNWDAQREAESVGNMEIEEDDVDGSAMEVVEKSFSVPGFLRKVFTEELGGGDDDGSRKHKLLVIAIHAVLLESGFVGFDMNLKTVDKGFLFQNDWPLNAFRLSMFYTLPEIIRDDSPSLEYHNYAIRLKFQSVGKFMSVYGSLSSGSVVHSVRLNEDELVSFLNVVWANCGLRDDIVMSEGGILGTSPEKEVFKFWRTVKDNLALPLLIDLCEKAGFGLPPCFMRLPTDLKLKILELLPGADVAKVSCVSSELRYLASSDDLWKQKFVEQFGDYSKLDEKGPWKERFASLSESRKRRKLASRSVHPRLPRVPGIIGGDPPIPWLPQVPRIIGGDPPIPWLPHVPRIIGGDHDAHPIFHPSGQMQGTRNPSRGPLPPRSAIIHTWH